MNTEEWISKGYNLLVDCTPKLIAALLIWIIGSWMAKLIVRTANRMMSKRGYDESLQKFLTDFLSWTLRILLIIVVLGLVGIDTTSFAALIGAAGLAVGLALQGSLSNFAGGVLIMIFKPYKVGDLIESQGHLGVVKEVQIFNSILMISVRHIFV